MFDEDDDPLAVSNVLKTHFQREPYADAGLTQKMGVPPIRPDIPASSASDSGKAAAVTIAANSDGMRSDNAKAYDFGSDIVSVRAALDGVTINSLNLDDFLYILKAFTNVVMDQRNEARIAKWRFDNGEIDQTAYDAIIDGLVPTY